MTNSDAWVTEVFAALDELRESGKTNMFGAAPYLEQLGADPREARALLAGWMQTFSRETPAAVRASEWIATREDVPA